MTDTMKVDLSSVRDMVLVREFDAPRALVWHCWTDPEHLAAWWGPDGFSNEVDLDLRPGGRQSITMIDAGGDRYPIEATYLEIVEEQRLVGAMTTGGNGEDWRELFAAHAKGASDGRLRLVMTVTFEDTATGGTRVTVRQTFPTQSERDANMALGAETGWGQSFGKLDRHLAGLES